MANYFPYDALSPIETINGEYIKVPAKYQQTLSDTSAADAGRTEDNVMHKLRIGQLVKLELTFTYLTTEELHELIRIFNPEYMSVKYFDILDNDWRTVTMYCGDRVMPMYNATVDRWTQLTVNLIEVGGNR